MDDENEMKQENMYGYDADRQNGGTFDERGQAEENAPAKTCQQNIIIIPKESSWLGFWKFMIHFCLFYGYFIDPFHIAFEISKERRTAEEKDTLTFLNEVKDDMTEELIIDIFLTIDILLNFITSFMRDGDWEKRIIELVKNYAKGSMIFDICATIPTLVSGQSNGMYWFKLFRFLQVRSVYGSISDMVRFFMTKCGMSKSNVEKISFIINLIIYMFSAIHILGCAWVYFGKINPCSWLKQSEDKPECGSGFYVDESDNDHVYVTAVYWVITTLTTVGYGDFKGYTPNEFLF